jgi:hypothetical protein
MSPDERLKRRWVSYQYRYCSSWYSDDGIMPWQDGGVNRWHFFFSKKVWSVNIIRNDVQCRKG